MEKQYWLNRWLNGETKFHEGKPNELLTRHFADLSLKPNSRLLVPLCGKSEDMAWLVNQGHRVVGVELSEMAVKAYFAERGLAPTVEKIGTTHTRYSVAGLELYVGDIFEMSPDMVGAVDAIYDRAAMIALPPLMRESYVQFLLTVSDSAPILLVSLEFDKTLLPAPPHPLFERDITEHYEEATHHCQLLERINVEGGIKGVCEGDETIWLIAKKPHL